MKIHKLGNMETHSYFIFDKNEEVVQAISKIAEIFNIKFSFFDKMKDDSGKLMDVKRSFEKTFDVHEKFSGNLRLDVFYGKDKLLLNLFGNKDERKKFSDALKNNFELPLAKFVEQEI